MKYAARQRAEEEQQRQQEAKVKPDKGCLVPWHKSFIYVYESIFTNNPISPFQLQRRFYPGTAGIAQPKKDTQHMQDGEGGGRGLRRI